MNKTTLLLLLLLSMVSNGQMCEVYSMSQNVRDRVTYECRWDTPSMMTGTQHL